MSTATKTTYRRFLRINRKENGWDDLACKLGGRGWTAGATAKACNLTACQVRTRWQRYGISPMDARYGHTAAERKTLADFRRALGNWRAPQRGEL